MGCQVTPSELALSYLSAFSGGDPDTIVSYVSEDFENNQISELGISCKGREVYRDRLGDFLKTFSELCYTPEEVIENGDRVAVAYRMNAKENDHPIEIRGVMLMVISDGLISRRNDYWDGISYQRQLGIGAQN